ncbi:MAG: hypothetical protein AAFQ06_02405 [Pseudomonadota bacterium]
MTRGFLVGGFWGLVLAVFLAVVLSLAAPRPVAPPDPALSGVAMPEPAPRPTDAESALEGQSEGEVAPEPEPEPDAALEPDDTPDDTIEAENAPGSGALDQPQSGAIDQSEPPVTLAIVAPRLAAAPEEAALPRVPAIIAAVPALALPEPPTSLANLGVIPPRVPTDPLPGTPSNPRQAMGPGPRAGADAPPDQPPMPHFSTILIFTRPTEVSGLSTDGLAPGPLVLPAASALPRVATAIPALRLAQSAPEPLALPGPSQLLPGDLALLGDPASPRPGAVIPQPDAPSAPLAGDVPTAPEPDGTAPPPLTPLQSIARAAPAEAQGPSLSEANSLLQSGAGPSAEASASLAPVTPSRPTQASPARVDPAAPSPEPPPTSSASSELEEAETPRPESAGAGRALPRIGAPPPPAARDGLGSTEEPQASATRLDETAEADADGPILQRYAIPFDAPAGSPRLAVILRDTGADPLDLSGLDLPLTLAIDPALPDAMARAEAYRAAGQEVLIYAGDLTPEGLTAAVEAVPMALGFLEAARQDPRRLRAIEADLAASGRALIVPARGLNAAVRGAQEAGQIAASLDAQALTPSELARALERAALRAEREGRALLEAPASDAVIEDLALWAEGARGSRVTLAPVSAVLLAGP